MVHDNEEIKFVDPLTVGELISLIDTAEAETIPLAVLAPILRRSL